MDIYCVKCGEPWESDSLHDVDGKSFKQAYHEFQRVGCEVFGSSHGEPGVDVEVGGLKASEAMSALFDALGDDVDGAAAMMEDWGF